MCFNVFVWVQDDQVVLQCTASVLKEQQIKLCLSCEGFGNRLCFLETTSNAQVRAFTVLLSLPSFRPSVFHLSVLLSSAECASRPCYMHIHPGTVALSPGPGGDAGQHSGDDRGELKPFFFTFPFSTYYPLSSAYLVFKPGFMLNQQGNTIKV